MKRSFKAIITLVLALTMIMSFSVAAYADGELPTETVGYGYGCPDAASVPMHGLAAENITIDGIDIELYSADGYVYVRLVDLAAAKLLRESADKLAELGLLYIKDGLILVKADGLTEDEVAALTAKVSALTAEVQIAVSVGDKFTLGNAGVSVLQVEIGGFSTPPVEAPAPAEPDESFTVTKLDVAAGTRYAPTSASPKGSVYVPNEQPKVTTLYITYGYMTYGNLALQNDLYGTYLNVDKDSNNYGKALNDSYIYLVKAEDDKNDYYYSINGKGYKILEDSFVDHTNMVEIFGCEGISQEVNHIRDEEHSSMLNNTVITISTSADGSNVIKTIKYEDDTPTFDCNNLPSEEEYTREENNNHYDPLKNSTSFNPKDTVEIVSDSVGTPIDEAKTVTAKVDNGITVNDKLLNPDNNTAPQNADASADAAQAADTAVTGGAADSENTAGAAGNETTGGAAGNENTSSTVDNENA